MAKPNVVIMTPSRSDLRSTLQSGSSSALSISDPGYLEIHAWLLGKVAKRSHLRASPCSRERGRERERDEVGEREINISLNIASPCRTSISKVYSQHYHHHHHLKLL